MSAFDELAPQTPPEPKVLAGRLEETSLVSLIQRLHAEGASGQLELARGALRLREGRVVAARLDQGGQSFGGEKAFHRLARERLGRYRLEIGEEPASSEDDPASTDAVTVDTAELLVGALEDSVTAYPAEGARLRLIPREPEPDSEPDPAGEDGPRGLLLDMLRRYDTVGAVLDACELPDLTLLRTLLQLRRQKALELLPPLPPVAVTTDPAADLPAEESLRLGLTPLPRGLCLGDDLVMDDGRLSARQVFECLEASGAEGWSRPLSPSARDSLALRQRRGCPVVLLVPGDAPFDPAEDEGGELTRVATGQLGPGLGLLTLMAARMAHRGDRQRVIGRRMHRFSQRLETLVGVEDPAFVHSHSRPAASDDPESRDRRDQVRETWAGRRPLLSLEQGRLGSVDRDGGELPRRLARCLEGRLEADRPVMLLTSHADDEEEAVVQLEAELVRRFRVLELVRARMRPTSALKAGPGGLAVAAFQPSEIEWQVIRPLEDLAPL